MRVFPSHRQVFKPCDLLVLPLLPHKRRCLHGGGHLAAQTSRQTSGWNMRVSSSHAVAKKTL